MQPNSAHNRTFFERTNLLAARLGLQIEELPRILGIGRRTLFECRSADSAVSGKSWAKLEIAERKVKSVADPVVEKSGIVESKGNPNLTGAAQVNNFLSEEPTPYRVTPREFNQQDFQRLVERVDKLERVLDAALKAWQSM